MENFKVHQIIREQQSCIPYTPESENWELSPLYIEEVQFYFFAFVLVLLGFDVIGHDPRDFLKYGLGRLSHFLCWSADFSGGSCHGPSEADTDLTVTDVFSVTSVHEQIRERWNQWNGTFYGKSIKEPSLEHTQSACWIIQEMQMKTNKESFLNLENVKDSACHRLNINSRVGWVIFRITLSTDS